MAHTSELRTAPTAPNSFTLCATGLKTAASPSTTQVTSMHGDSQSILSPSEFMLLLLINPLVT